MARHPRDVERRRVLGVETQPVVFGVSAALTAVIVVFGVVWTEAAGTFFDAIQTFIVHQLGWFYTLVISGFLLFVLWIAFSPFGRIRLGPDDARPAYGYLTWFAMLFSAGMGIGVLFWSVAEPLNHFAVPPYGEAETVAAAQQAVSLTFLH
ncbi:hypothetical protein FTX61_01790 [Nitriliruptoraceae bacterium ZYF776]|nr:hypothetical protein [Profundirhabdus halotolerans]